MSGIREKMTRPRRLLRAAILVPDCERGPVTSSAGLALRRLSPLLLLAAALVALAVLFAPGGRSAQAQTAFSGWSATLTVQDLSTALGCGNLVATVLGNDAMACSTASTLTDDEFAYEGVDYEVIQINISPSANLTLQLSKTIPSGLTLFVDGTAFRLSDAILATDANTNDQAAWTNTGLSWTAGDTVSLSLSLDPTQPTTHWSDTLTVQQLDFGGGVTGRGCGHWASHAGRRCTDSGVLTNGGNITYHGATYKIEMVMVAYGGGTLQFKLDREPWDSDGSQTEFSRLALVVDGREFAFADGTVTRGIAEGGYWTNTESWNLHWLGTDLAWNENDAISLKLITPPVGGL